MPSASNPTPFDAAPMTQPSHAAWNLAVLAETRPDSRCWLFDPCGTCHPFSSSHQFLLCERERVKKGLHRGLAEAPAAVMRPLLVVVDEPGIEIGLQFLDRAIDLFTERHPIELVEQRAMEALADAVGLWALGLGAAVIDVLDRQVELVLVAFPAAELGAAIGQHPAQPDAVLIVERHHPIVEDLGGGDWRLAVIELGEGHLGVGIDKGLLINPPDALQRAHVEGVLRTAIARALALELAMRFLSALAFSSAVICASVNRMPSCAALASSALRRCFIEVRSWRCHTQRTPAGEIDNPRRFSASETRTWPQAGCSIAISTTASSISGAVRFFRIGLRRLISCSASSPPLSYSSFKR